MPGRDVAARVDRPAIEAVPVKIPVVVATVLDRYQRPFVGGTRHVPDVDEGLGFQGEEVGLLGQSGGRVVVEQLLRGRVQAVRPFPYFGLKATDPEGESHRARELVAGHQVGGQAHLAKAGALVCARVRPRPVERELGVVAILDRPEEDRTLRDGLANVGQLVQIVAVRRAQRQRSSRVGNHSELGVVVLIALERVERRAMQGQG